MPNHVLNEIRFRGLTDAERARLIANIAPEGHIDFGFLLPVPANYWQSSVSQVHEKTFPGTALNWCRQHWGTKWNAYGLDENGGVTIGEDGSLTLTFQTAWSPPYGWLLAIFNTAPIASDVAAGPICSGSTETMG